MAPSITIGAVILSWRKAPTKVIVSHAPSGTVSQSPGGWNSISLKIALQAGHQSIYW
jgi:hypothetical protein